MQNESNRDKTDRTQGSQGSKSQAQTQQGQNRTGPDSGNARGSDLPSSNRDTQRDTSRGVQGAGSQKKSDDLDLDTESSNIDAAAPGHDIDDKPSKSPDSKH